jgi:2-dehydropantoate 2-reductase
LEYARLIHVRATPDCDRAACFPSKRTEAHEHERDEALKILVVGAGAVGGFVGGRLAQAGRDVTFLVRPRRAAQLAERGLRISDGTHTDVIDPRTVTRETLDGPYDLIILGVKAEALAAAIEDFAPAVGPETAVVPFINGVSHIEPLTRAFGPAVLGGVLKIVTQLDPDGDIRQFVPGGGIEVGRLDGAADAGIAAIVEVLAIPGFNVSVPDSILDAMWAKWVFIATIGAITSIARGPIGEVTAVVGGAAFAQAVLEEAASVALVAGHELSGRDYEETRALVTAQGTQTTSSLSRDLVAGRPTEVEAVLGDLIDVAHAAALSVPRLEAAALTLRTHNARIARTRGEA